MPKMYTQRTKPTALFSIVFIAALLIASFNSFAGDIQVSVAKKSYNGSEVSCYRAQDAQLTITATGGNGNYTYSIDNGKNYQASNTFSNLAGSQNYVVVVKDSKGQTSSAQWVWVGTVANPVTITSSNVTRTTCTTSMDGELSFTAYGGTGDLVFSIDNGANWQRDTRFRNLAAGTYNLIAKDANGCTSDYKMIKIESGTGVKAVIDYKEDYSCTWGNGRALVRGANGVAPYMYSIDGLPYVSDNNFTNLAPGTHTIIAVDSKGCTGSVSVEINAVLTATLSGDTTIQEGGVATLHINIVEASTKKAGYTVVLEGSDGQKYTFNQLKTGDNIVQVQSIPATTVFTISRVTSTSGCISYNAGAAVVTVEAEKKSIWLGLSSDWNDQKNWSNGRVPSSGSVVLLEKKASDPVISEESFARDITIGKGASLLITGKLNLSGTISGEAQSVEAGAGTIEFSGTEMQELSGAVFTGKGIRNMIINNDLSLVDSLNVFGYIQFNVAGKDFYTNDLLTLKSTAEGSAMVGNLSRNQVLGKVTVEDYIAPRKGWKFLSVPTGGGQSIHDAWQEGYSDNIVGAPARGTQITGEMSDWKAKGFDAKAYAPSMKMYNSGNDTWVGIKSTFDSFKDSSNAYMIFVRGDRSATTVDAPVNETTLRTKGELKSGDQKVYDITPGKFIAVGNPYAAPLDLSKVSTSRNMIYYFWDAELGSSYGAYQTLKVNKNGTFKVVPGSKKIDNKKVLVESGQAFFVYSKNGGTLQITEDSKADINDGTNRRPAGFTGEEADDDELEIKMYAVNNGEVELVDGIFQSFNSAYSIGYDEMDALKSANTGENLSIKSNGKNLAIESRSFSQNADDTTQLYLTGVKYQTYRFEISRNHHANDREAILVDRFTGRSASIMIGATLNYEFTITTSAGSYATNRFMIIFRPMKPMPVTFSSVNAEKQQEQVAVNWKVENEVNVKQYNVERSADGVSFSAIGNVAATGAGKYHFNDVNPISGVNYYRVFSIDVDGKKGYTEIVKVSVNTVAGNALTVYPNPVIGNSVNLQLKVQAKGIYYISIKNQLGQVIDSRKVNLSGNQSLEISPATKLSSGVYTVELTNPAGEQSVVRFIK